jgi:hypothetical protein
MLLNIVICFILVAVFAVLIMPRVRNNKNWDSMVTPLASIIGSGFLVSVPLLASSVGLWSLPAIAVLTAVAFLFGGAVRYNIRYGEQVFSSPHSNRAIKSVETLSHIVLTGAYFISVAYYLVLLSAFGMKLVGIESDWLGKAIATALVTGICLVGAIRGLSDVEHAEEFTVSANLAAIAALLVGLVIFNLNLPEGYDWSGGNQDTRNFNWDTIRFLMGLLIIVQGFETTRFMGDLYDQETRIRAMRRAQITASLVYLVFFALMVPLFPYFTSSADVAGFIQVIERVSPWLPFIVTGGAIASQFSASVADSIGASGLIHDTSEKSVSSQHAYILIGVIAVLVIWATDVTSIVSLASRAFAFFYALQCAVAALLARDRKNWARLALFSTLGLIALTITVFGIPAAG